MHMHEHQTYDLLKRFVLKYVRVLQGLRRKAKGINLMQDYAGEGGG